MKKLTSLILLLFILSYSTSLANNYLNKSKVIKIGGSSVGLALVGYLTENSVTESRSSFIKGPILFDQYFHERIRGDLNSADYHSNFLDNKTGAVLTPAICMTFLAIIDYSYYSVNRKKQMFQDCFLYTSGLLTTVGITGLFKGLVARERPFYYEQKDTGIIFEDDYKLSFFRVIPHWLFIRCIF